MTVSYSVTDNCPLPPNSCTLDVTSNEPIGHTSPDWVVLGARHVQLRAEREGNGHGRIYTITVSCSDSGGSLKSQCGGICASQSKENFGWASFTMI